MDDDKHTPKRKKFRRGPYKRYLRDETIGIPKQTRSRWNRRNAALVSALQEDANVINEDDLGEIHHHHEHFEEQEALQEAANVINEDSDDEVFYDAEADQQHIQPELNEDEILYEGAPLSKAQSTLLIMAYAIRHNLTRTGTQDLLTLINSHLPYPSVQGSNYLLRKACMFDLTDDIIYYSYCGQCSGYLGAGENLTCNSCGTQTTKAKNIKDGLFFVHISLASQLKSILETPDFKLLAATEDDGVLSGILDGSVHNKLRSDILGEDDVTLTFNSDGISAFHSSNSSVWPILCTVNELSARDRKKHVMMAGIWFGNGKPVMQTFLKSFVEECEHMAEDGILWTNPATGREVCSKVFAIACACDSVARCQLQGLVQFNGYFGCSWCLHPGVRHEGTRHVYPHQDPPHSLRTQFNFTRDAIQARANGQNSNGVKPDPSPLLLLPQFDIVKGFPIDYMHCVYEGVTSKLMSLWFDSIYHHEEWYIGRSIPEIDRRLKSITPPSEITRLPCSPSQRAQWKASEFRSWLLFYSLPILNGILPFSFMKHLILLVHGIWLLTKSHITVADIASSREVLNTFVKKMESLYGRSHMTYNTHMLLHLTDTVTAWGPLWTSSCFLFEGYNRQIKSLFHGTRGIPHQIANNFAIVQGLSKRLNVMDGTPELAAFFKSLVTGYPLVPSVYKVIDDDADILLKGKPSIFPADDADDVLSITNYFNNPLVNLEITEYCKVVVNGISFAKFIDARQSKRADSMVVYGPKQIGQVKRILHVEHGQTSEVVLVVQPFLVENHSIISRDQTYTLAEHIVTIIEGPVLPPLIFPVSFAFFKCVQIVLDDKHYCCVLPNMIELD